MNRFGSPSEDHQPVTWIRGYPVYATHFIVLVYVVSMMVTSTLLAMHAGGVSEWLYFESGRIFKGEVWRYFTYGLWNRASISPFAFDMLWLTLFGREVEKFFGRGKFLRLYGVIYLLTPLLFTVLGIWWSLPLVGETGAFAVFIAFATLHPGAELMFGVLAKWAALILFGIFTLMALQDHDYPSLLSLWVTCGFAYAFVRYEQGEFAFPSLRFWRRGPKLRVLPLPEDEESPEKNARGSAMAEVDALLDKIARSGISSLTAKERAKLDRARDDLKNRGSRRG
jgi:membrane associated rhomboid family serine protease